MHYVVQTSEVCITHVQRECNISLRQDVTHVSITTVSVYISVRISLHSRLGLE